MVNRYEVIKTKHTNINVKNECWRASSYNHMPFNERLSVRTNSSISLNIKRLTKDHTTECSNGKKNSHIDPIMSN